MGAGAGAGPAWAQGAGDGYDLGHTGESESVRCEFGGAGVRALWSALCLATRTCAKAGVVGVLLRTCCR